jgi:hypothetical protein
MVDCIRQPWSRGWIEGMPRQDPELRFWRRLEVARVVLVLATVATAACGAADLLPGVVTGIVVTVLVAMTVVSLLVITLRPCARCGEPDTGSRWSLEYRRPCPKCGYPDGD